MPIFVHMRKRLRAAILPLLLLAPLAIPEAALAQPKYPDHALKLIVGFATGGAADTVGRTLAEQLGKKPDVVAALYQALVEAVRTPAMAERFAALGMETTLSESPAEAQKFYLSELTRWSALIKAAGIKAE